MLQKSCFGGNLSMKIDIRKAFDTLDWNFILDVLEAFGFSFQFRDWILSLFLSARISILINGKITGYFPCSRGVRQGDPLSHLLFCLAEDFLSRLISLKVDSGGIKPMMYTRNLSFPSHFLYADDILLFAKASMHNIRAINGVFRCYANLSGQVVNWAKSEVYYGASINEGRTAKLQGITGMIKGSLPFNYLGVPLFTGAPKKKWLRPLADKICGRYSKWKGNSLSRAGRLTHVNSVIISSLLHSFAIYKWPLSLISYIERCMCNFIWSGSIDCKKLVTLPWRMCCLPLSEGGFGIKQLKVLNDAILSKTAWNLIAVNSYPMNILRSHFLHSLGIGRESYFRSSVWSSIKNIYASLRLDIMWYIGENINLNFWTDEWVLPKISN